MVRWWSVWSGQHVGRGGQIRLHGRRNREMIIPSHLWCVMLVESLWAGLFQSLASPEPHALGLCTAWEHVVSCHSADMVSEGRGAWPSSFALVFWKTSSVALGNTDSAGPSSQGRSSVSLLRARLLWLPWSGADVCFAQSLCSISV